ncbi:hypothetical protein [Streptomyces albidoflavus]|uniref:hypothetical protein n=1 Tax=Streptomyces albidoflavus TaxID=1886 RepID=UPI0033241699
MNLASLMLRRSLAWKALPAFLILVVLNTLLRPLSWRHEPMWAVYQYNFTVMLLGPLVAGVAGWEGYRISRSSDFLSGHHRPIALLASTWAAVFAWCAAAFIAGLAVVIGIVAGSGTPMLFGIHELVTPLPALALLAAECALGLVAGWIGRSKLAAPLAAITIFLATLLLYAGDLSEFVMVGGATSSLVGLQPKLSTQMAQALFYCSVTLVSLLLGAWFASWYRIPRWPVLAGASALACAAALQLATVSPLYLEERKGDVECSGSSPEICLGRSYTGYEPHLRKNLAPFVEAMHTLDLPSPAAFRQDALTTDRDTGQLGLDTIQGDKDLLVDMFLGTYYGSSCEILPGNAMEKHYFNARFWLANTAGATPNDDPVVDPKMIRGTVKERADLARASFKGLMSCNG